MLDANVIEPDQSDWASPVVLVSKPDGSLLCRPSMNKCHNGKRHIPTTADG